MEISGGNVKTPVNDSMITVKLPVASRGTSIATLIISIQPTLGAVIVKCKA